MADPIKRPRYFNGQLLREEDFNLAQNYLIARDSWHGRQFHSPGVAEGLAVDAGVGASQAKISPGSGMDSLGRPIVLVEEVLLPLDRLANRTVLVVISYAETPSDPASSGAGDFTRWQERPEVAVVPEGAGAPPESTHLRLARLVLDANSKVKEHDATVRRFAGTRLGNELELRRLVLSREGVASSGWPALTCGAANRVDINSGSGTLSPGLALSSGEDFFSVYGARQDKPSHDLLWRRGPLRFGTASSPGGQAFSEKLRITEAGNLGVGNVDPGNYRLVLRQSAPNSGTGLRITNPDANKSLQLWVGTGGGVVDAEGTTDLHLRTNGQDRLFIQNAGNVGIGTTTPRARLEVSGDLLTRGLTLDNGGPDGARLVWLAQGKTEWRARNNATLDFFQQEGTPAVLTLAPGGNVGIGAQGPTERLHVGGNTRIDGVLSVFRAADDTNAGVLNLGREVGSESFWHITQRSGDQDKLMIFRRNPAAPTLTPPLPARWEGPYLAITTDGKVGIGTAAPGARLEVKGELHLNSGEADGARLVWWAKDSAEWRARNFSGTLGFFPGEGKPTVLSLTATSVNIGTTLHVAGTSVLAQEAWKAATFLNGWTNYGGPYNEAAYMKDSLGFVHLRGLVKSGTAPVIFSLPEGYRPAKRHVFGVATRPNTIGRIDVLANGDVQMEQGDSGWISLDGITFQAGFTRGFDLGNVDADRFNPNLIPGIRVGPVGPQLPPLP